MSAINNCTKGQPSISQEEGAVCHLQKNCLYDEKLKGKERLFNCGPDCCKGKSEEKFSVALYIQFFFLVEARLSWLLLWGDCYYFGTRLGLRLSKFISDLPSV